MFRLKVSLLGSGGEPVASGSFGQMRPFKWYTWKIDNLLLASAWAAETRWEAATFGLGCPVMWDASRGLSGVDGVDTELTDRLIGICTTLLGDPVP